MNIFKTNFNNLKNRPSLKIKLQTGFTLIEVLVSVTLFAVIMLSATNVFKLALDAQKKSVIAQNVQESLRYSLEVIGKEIRMAQRDNGTCTSTPDTKIFATGTNSYGDFLSFKNYHGECVRYYLLGATGLPNRFVINRGSSYAYITPATVDISNLRFIVKEATSSQALVTFSFKAEAVTPGNGRSSSSDIYIQSSIASRYYLDN